MGLFRFYKNKSDYYLHLILMKEEISILIDQELIHTFLTPGLADGQVFDDRVDEREIPVRGSYRANF